MEKTIESIPSGVLNDFERWHWPGNIRELGNFIERAVILTKGTVLNVPFQNCRRQFLLNRFLLNMPDVMKSFAF